MNNANNEYGYETVKLGTLLANNIKQYNKDVNELLAKTEASVTQLVKEIELPVKQSHRVHTIRRRRKFVFHAADQIINKGYWSREKRSLTKYHSNSLMYEYTLIK